MAIPKKEHVNCRIASKMFNTSMLIYCFTIIIVIGGCVKKGTKEPIRQDQLTNTIKPVATRDSAFIHKLMLFLTQNITDSILHLEWNGSPGDTLFGLPPMKMLSLTGNTQSSGQFYHYNTTLLAKINTALDFFPVNDLVKNLSTYELVDHYSGISFYFRGCRDTTLSGESIAELLIPRLHLKNYPEELRKYRKRYQRLLNYNSDEFRPCSLDVAENLNSAMVAFWVRRSFDGSDTLLESILTKVFRLSNPTIYNKIFGQDNPKSNEEVTSNVTIFTHNSYCDEEELGVQPSLLECRDDILYGNSAKLDSISDFGEKPDGTLVIKGVEANSMLGKTTCNSKFFKSNNYFALVEQSNKNIGWNMVNPSFTITFQAFPEACEEDKGRFYWAVLLNIGIEGDTTTPLVFAAFPQNSAQKPGTHFASRILHKLEERG